MHRLSNGRRRHDDKYAIDARDDALTSAEGAFEVFFHL